MTSGDVTHQSGTGRRINSNQMKYTTQRHMSIFILKTCWPVFCEKIKTLRSAVDFAPSNDIGHWFRLGLDLWPDFSMFRLKKFKLVLCQSIALFMLYNFGFESEFIWLKIWPRLNKNWGPRVSAVCVSQRISWFRGRTLSRIETDPKNFW